MRWVGHVALIVDNRNANWKERDHLKDLGVDGKIILKRILKQAGWEGLNWIC
jgi:hypothetical protein